MNTLGKYVYAFRVKGTDDYLVVDQGNSQSVFIQSIDSDSGYPAEALFRNRSAFTTATGSDQFSSFESLSKPGHFLRHTGYVLFVNEEEPSEVYKQDASWKIVK